MRPYGETRLGFFPLPVAESQRLKKWLTFPERFSVLDPCVGDGVAFAHLLQGVACNRHGIEIDANRAEQARTLGIETLQANTYGCPVSAGSSVFALPEPSVRLGSRGGQQPRD